MIAIYVHALVATGVVRQALTLAETLARSGHGVELITALPSDRPMPAGVRAVPLLDGTLASRWREHVVATRALRRHLAAHRPALLISAGNHGHATVWTAARGLTAIRRVYRISNDIVRAHPGSPGGGSIKAQARAGMAALIARDADHIVLVSPTLLDAPAYAAAAAQGRATVITNGIDVAAARERAVGPAPHPWLRCPVPTVIAVGRLAPQKNFETLLAAFAKLQQRREARLILLGESRDDARATLFAQAKSLGFIDRFAMPGIVDNIFPWLAHADVFALPSWWEGSANVLLEAMAVGTPVVASLSAGNAAGLLDGGRHGLLVAPNNAMAMADAIAAQLDPATMIVPGEHILDHNIAKPQAAWRTLIDGLLGDQRVDRAA